VYLGIDIGTSSVKALACDERGRVRAEASAALEVSRPRPLWSEQDPDAWWDAADRAVSAVRAKCEGDWTRLRGIGLSGQMHGATLLGRDGAPLRPAILWNDGRSAAECSELENAVPDLHGITGNLAMPGFTAPKLLWVRRHEPEIFERIAHVLLPKDYVRLRMTGERATDLSDASGTLWVDVGTRQWSKDVLDACGLEPDTMPRLHEGPESTGRLRAEVAEAWGCDRVEVVAGGGDNAAGAVGIGAVEPGRAFLSLGTSGVYFLAGDAFRPNPAKAVHAFCHALPGRWHQMSVLLSAASCLDWVARMTGASDEAALLAEVEAVGRPSDRLMFLPYLSGERTPHNDPWASGVFVGLDHETDRAALGRAVLEGVAHAFVEAEGVLLEAGSRIDDVTVIGGGARSRLWGRILASALDRPLVYREGAAVGPALGAARLAMMGVGGIDEREACRPGAVVDEVEPDPALVAHYRERQPLFTSLYPTLRAAFRTSAALTRETRP
jgi:xylulokinase